MGKEDKKSKRGKIASGTFGVSRPKRKHINSAKEPTGTKTEHTEKKAATKKSKKVEAQE